MNNPDIERTKDAIKTAAAMDDCGPIGLQYLADAPILNPVGIFLPLGRCSQEEVRRREAVRL
jgi:hypothetical protein